MKELKLNSLIKRDLDKNEMETAKGRIGAANCFYVCNCGGGSVVLFASVWGTVNSGVYAIAQPPSQPPSLR